MKKYLIVVFCALFAVALVGCGKKNQVTCTGTMSEGGLTIKAEAIGDFDANDKLTEATVIYDLGDKTTAEQYCSLFKMFESSEKGISISCSGSKITIKGYAQMEAEEGEENLIGASKDDFIKAMEKESFTCKK